MEKLEIEGLRLSYGRREILHNISFSVAEHAITAIIGQSGCGKSTVLKTMNRISQEDGARVEGNIFLDGESIFEMPKDALRKRVGLVFQQPVVFPFSVEKNLRYTLSYHFRLTKAEQDAQIRTLLQQTRLYNEVREHLSMPAERLSGGQQQRLAIARSLCVRPEVLLLDEPCSALDMNNTIAIEELLLELKEQYTIVIVTHNLAQAKRIADRVIFMDDGNIIEYADKDAFFAEPQTEIAKRYLQYME